jgi:replication factor C subunit 3/5
MAQQYANLPWIEKYRPSNLSEIIDEGNKVDILRGLIEKDELPHLLFYGPPGTGKTSLILACAREYYGSNFRKYVLELNASDDRGIDTVRKQIPEFVKTSTNKIKMVILDEADALTGDAQGALRRVIEQFSKYCRFCLICNNIYKIIGGLKSRCVVIRFGKLPSENIKEKLSNIIEQEKVRISDETIDFILKNCGDFRQVLNILQLQHTLKHTLEGEEYELIDERDICRYLGIPTQNQFDQIIHSLLYRRLRDNVNRLVEDHGNNLYSLVELVRMLTSWTVEQKRLTIGLKKKIIEGLSEIDYRLKNSMGESDIQIYALASIFLGLGQIIDKGGGGTQVGGT